MKVPKILACIWLSIVVFLIVGAVIHGVGWQSFLVGIGTLVAVFATCVSILILIDSDNCGGW